MSRTFARLSASKTALAMIRESSRLIGGPSPAACLPCVLCASNTASEIILFRCVSFGIWHPINCGTDTGQQNLLIADEETPQRLKHRLTGHIPACGDGVDHEYRPPYRA